MAYEMARIETLEQRAYGFHIPGMPVLDVNLEPRNPIINTRAISDDPQLVTEIGLAMLRGIIDARGVTCTMHFPGHGSTIDDSHIRMPVDSRSAEEIREIDWAPYRPAIAQRLINGVCTNHIHYPAFEPDRAVPATVSRGIVTGLLRDELGYDGLIMSDSLTMKPMKDEYGIEEAAILSVIAGHDIILQDYQSEPRITHAALVEAVKSGRIDEAQVDASCARVMNLKQWVGLFDERLVDTGRIPERVATPEYMDFAMDLARKAVTALSDDAVPLRVENESKCVVIANGSDVVWNEDMGIAHMPTYERFYQAVQKRLPGAGTLTLSEEMGPHEVAEAGNRAMGAETVIFGIFTRVICYNEDSIGILPQYAELIRRTKGAGKRVVLMNFGNPYIMAGLPECDAAICTYDDECPESIEAGVEALFGEIEATGQMPVRLG